MMLDQRGRHAAEELREYAAERIRPIEVGDLRRIHRRRRLVSTVATAVMVAAAIVGTALLIGGPESNDDVSPVVTQPTAPAPATTLPTSPTLPPPTPSTVPSTIPEEVEPGPAGLLTYEEMYRRFEERNVREAAEYGFPVSDFRLGYDDMQRDFWSWSLTEAVEGESAPDLAGNYLGSFGLYAGETGTFARDDLIGSPTVVMLWQLKVGETPNERNLAAFQELMETDLAGVQLLTVLLQPSSPEYVQEMMSQRGYTFPILVATEPGVWGIEADSTEGVIEFTPLWFALDEDWRPRGVFIHEAGYAHFLVAEFLGVPDIGPIDDLADHDVTGFTKADGLPSDCVSSIEVAGNGDVWVGSGCGVARYDGFDWFEYLPGEGENSVYEAPDGGLWVASIDAVYRVDGTELIPVLTDNPWEGEFGSLAVATDGTMWLSNGDQMNWSYDGVEWRSHPDSAPVGMFTAAPDGSLWAGNETEMRRFDGAVWEIIDHPAKWPISPTFAPDGTPWVEGGEGGVFQYEDGAWIHHDLGGTYLDDIAFGPDGDLWAASPNHGAYHYDGETWTRFTTADGLPTNLLTAVAVAPDGTVWFGTLESGVVEFTP